MSAPVRIICFAIVVVLLGGCWPSQDIPKSQPKAASFSIASEIGRYQIVFSPHMREDTFIIDTETGRIWQMTEMADLPSKPMVWEEMTRFESPNDELIFRATMGDKSPAAQGALDKLLKGH